MAVLPIACIKEPATKMRFVDRNLAPSVACRKLQTTQSIEVRSNPPGRRERTEAFRCFHILTCNQKNLKSKVWRKWRHLPSSFHHTFTSLVCMLNRSTCIFTRTSSRLFPPAVRQAAKMSTSKFPVSDRVAPELEKSSDVWSVFSPLAGHVPKDALNLGQVSFSFPLQPHLR